MNKVFYAFIILLALNQATAQFGGLHDYIYTLSRDQLTRWALAAEQYHREKTNFKGYGGLHDYVRSLTTKQIANYILEKVHQYPELEQQDLLEKLSQGSRTVKSIYGGMEDYLRLLDRSEMERWALAAERYHREKINFTGYGGLHDRLRFMSDSDLSTYILDMANQYPEFNRPNFLRDLAKNSDIAVPEKLEMALYTFDRKTLEKYALAAEFYVREKSGVEIDGGLHDYIGTLKDQDLRDFLVKMIRENPEIDDRQVLDDVIESQHFLAF